ncbi:hexon [Psittacine adenovirus 2]|uniref:Hexon protein n=3 Tax=Psittacine adenovirus 2 TaxID=1301246 RepID=A0ABX8SN88_9ADEN|nr:hexon [Psittacine adenovirus 2]QZW33251.1 ORF12 hexon [Psittacine siadenovirus F]QXX30956.1 hexon [Psittacine adenovirus 2]QZW33695.1 ORF12 hexon [Psittacine adenovirus 2]WGL41020.1 hexon [Psittacine siadenovirus F]
MDISNGTPKLDIFHIAGQEAAEYLSENLVDFISNTESYFPINKKFRETIVAPTKGVTTEQSQRLQVRIVPSLTQDLEHSYTARFTISVGDGRVLDMGSTYFDIRGTVDRGISFKPYCGTMYNPLAPRSAQFNNVKEVDNLRILTAQASNLYNFTGAGCAEAQTKYNTFSPVVPSPNLGFSDSSIEHDKEGGAGRVVQQHPGAESTAYGAYSPAVRLDGSQLPLDKTISAVYTNAGKAGDAQVTSVFASEELPVRYPDTRVVYYDAEAKIATRMGTRPNYIGFRDNFIGLLYYDNGAHSGSLASETGDINLVEQIQDRNTEISYQYLLADLMSRQHYFTQWNQAVDDYDLGIRVLTNTGYEEGPPAFSFPSIGLGNYPDKAIDVGKLVTNNGQVATEIQNTIAAVGFGSVPNMEMNIHAYLQRSWLFANVAEYLPDQFKTDAPGFSPGARAVAVATQNFNTYSYLNARLPNVNVIDLFTNPGGRYSLDIMDNVNPFNHHKNRGLQYRSQILGNGRVADFHIQVPQKFFAIKSLLLLPGSYSYEWWFRKDPNIVLQSSLGNDLRNDGASITYKSINLYASFFPMDHATASDLILMLRNDGNDQTFMDYMGAKHNLYVVPPNTNNLQIEIPSRAWTGFRGWSFNRVKAQETPAVWSTFDINFKYSGSIPYLDSTFYLSHTFNSVAITFDSAIPWPGNDRLLLPNYFEIKRQYTDSEGYCTCQSNMTKDWWLIQMSANYNQGYHGYSFPLDKTFRQYDFIANFDPMAIQAPTNVIDLSQQYLTNPDVVIQNSGYVPPRTLPIASGQQGHPYPANWPYPIIGAGAGAGTGVRTKTKRKFLCDKYLWTIPFSSNFMNMGELTDLGQSLLYTESAHSLQITFDLDPMEEVTYVYMLYNVFDCVRINQPNKNYVSAAYFRTPFATGTAAV